MSLDAAEFLLREIEVFRDLSEQEQIRVEVLRLDLAYLRKEVTSIETRARSLRDRIENSRG